MLPQNQLRYRPLSTEERPDSTVKPKAQARSAYEAPDHSQEQPPLKAIALAVVLLVVGIILLVLGGLHLRGHIYSKDGAGLGLLILGVLTFLPGWYSTRIAIYAWLGYPGFNYSFIPY